MMKCEFLQKVEEIRGQQRGPAKISDEDYSVIEFVYTWHPSISETEGKREIAELYCKFGMRIIQDMFCTANNHKNLVEIYERKLKEVEQIKEQIDALKEGGGAGR